MTRAYRKPDASKVAAVNEGEIFTPVKRKAVRTRRDPTEREFIAWDGEGMNLRGEDRPQAYVLLGCSTGDKITSYEPAGLHTLDICRFVIDVGRRFPHAFHVGFALNYDTNMIIQSLSEEKMVKLYRKGFVYIDAHVGRYCITYNKGKWFSISHHKPNYDSKTRADNKFTVKIYDIFGFFTCSFVKAVHQMLGCGKRYDGLDEPYNECNLECLPALETVERGKAKRGKFTLDDIEYVETYWTVEIEFLRQVAEILRKRIYGAGFHITQWYGPGALASYTLSKRNVKSYMKVSDANVRDAAKHAYAGGRFELYKVGRIHRPIYGYDINSAYPDAISQLPNLQDGRWHHTTNVTDEARWFALYHVRMRWELAFPLRPAPLFHRDERGNISYPWFVEGWYWGPEIKAMEREGIEGYEIVEGYEFIPNNPDAESPFKWVRGMYETRQQWKAAGNPNQLALKLNLNSLYGKMAQRVGWRINKDGTVRLPPFFQLEWAGWITSYTRARLFQLLARIPQEHLVAVETDGIYTTMPPDILGIKESTDLGGWSIDRYDEIIYLQSGLAWLRKGDEWSDKRRGLDPKTFTLDHCRDYVKTLHPNEPWKPFIGEQTRFIGLGAAIQSERPTKSYHCLWSTTTKELLPGEKGKRIHIAAACEACKQGLNAYDAPHDLVVRSLSRAGEMSYPHYLPWEDSSKRKPDWLSTSEMEIDLIGE